MLVVESITGGAEIDRALKMLDETVQKSAIGKALKVGGKILLDDALAHVPVKTGAAKESLREQLSRSKAGQAVRIGTSSKWFTGDSYYVAFLEFGHKQGKRPSKRKSFQLGQKDSRKQIPGRHFIENAFNSKATQAVDAFMAELRLQIEKAMASAKSESP